MDGSAQYLKDALTGRHGHDQLTRALKIPIDAVLVKCTEAQVDALQEVALIRARRLDNTIVTEPVLRQPTPRNIM